MTILRNRTQGNFTVINNVIMRDKRLGMNARGLLCTMLSLPDTWEFSEKGLQSILPENGISAIKTSLNVLQKCGYLKRYKVRGKSGTFSGWEWEVTDTPGKFHVSDSQNQAPRAEKPMSDESTSENLAQLSTNGSNYLRDDIYMAQSENQGEKSKEKKRKQFKPPTLEECKAYHDQMGYTFDVDYFYAYYQASDWHKGDGKKVTSWKQCMVTFERNKRAYSPKQESREPVSVAGTAYDF